MNSEESKNMNSNINSVLGISMGDEGKGRVVHEIMDEIQEKYNCPRVCYEGKWWCKCKRSYSRWSKVKLITILISNPKYLTC